MKRKIKELSGSIPGEYCLHCNKRLSEQKKYKRAKFCDETCQRSEQRKIHYSNTSPVRTSLSKSNVGAVSELVVCADLIKKGYNVFRCVSANSPVDIIIKMNSDVFCVEVKTAIKSDKTGCIVHPNPSNKDYDILALYLIEENQVHYKNKQGEYIWDAP